MCLDSKNPRPEVREGVGYKVFRKGRGDREGMLISPVRTLTPAFKFNEWATDVRDDYRHFASNGRAYKYRTGFHLFKTLLGAKRMVSGYWAQWAIVKVEFKSVVATGRQNRAKVIVARSIRPTTVVEQSREKV